MVQRVHRGSIMATEISMHRFSSLPWSHAPGRHTFCTQSSPPSLELLSRTQYRFKDMGIASAALPWTRDWSETRCPCDCTALHTGQFRLLATWFCDSAKGIGGSPFLRFFAHVWFEYLKLKPWPSLPLYPTHPPPNVFLGCKKRQLTKSNQMFRSNQRTYRSHGILPNQIRDLESSRQLCVQRVSALALS